MKLGLLSDKGLPYFVAENDIQPCIWTRDRWVQPVVATRGHPCPVVTLHTSRHAKLCTLHNSNTLW